MSEDSEDTIVQPERPLPRPGGIRGTLDDDGTVVGGVSPGRSASVDEPEPERAAVSSQQYYQFQVGTHHAPISLDRPVLIGRRPSAPRVLQGAVPLLLRVPSELSEVSSTHLEVRQIGGSVIITDLKTTNGSMVMVPGSVPRKLRQGESVVVSPGTLVDIGDGNVLHILPMQRLGQVDSSQAKAEDRL